MSAFVSFVSLYFYSSQMVKPLFHLQAIKIFPFSGTQLSGCIIESLKVKRYQPREDAGRRLNAQGSSEVSGCFIMSAFVSFVSLYFYSSQMVKPLFIINYYFLLAEPNYRAAL
jgi:hypothetical protein